MLNQAKVNPKAFASNRGGSAPELTVFGVLSAAQNKRLPAPKVMLSIVSMATTVPQLAEGVANVRVALLLMRPSVPVLAVVLPADCVPEIAARLEARVTRA
jgi:hypothetical protein